MPFDRDHENMTKAILADRSAIEVETVKGTTDADLAKHLLAKIRSQIKERPLVKVHTGSLDELKELRSNEPGAAITDTANEFVEEWLEQPGNRAEHDISPVKLEDDMVYNAEWAHALSWAYTEDDAEAWELLRHMVLSKAAGGHEGCKNMLPHLMVSDGHSAFGWYGKWYHYGCQSIEIDDKYAASLCATKIAKSELDYVHLPWPCFIVRVPKFLQTLRVNGEPLRLIIANLVRYEGAVTLTGPEAKRISGEDRLQANTSMDRYQLHLITANKYRILPANSLAEWVEPNPMKSYDEFRLTEVDYAEKDRRQLEVIGRLVVGAVIAMNDPKLHKRYPKSNVARDRQPGRPRANTNPNVVLHKIGRPVQVDARETIAAYANGQKSRVTNVRTLVAGHWKNQVYGPRNSLRRWQHLECYWRGDPTDPLIIRPHVLSGEG